MSEPEQGDALRIPPVARWVLGLMFAMAMASAPALVTYGVMRAELAAVVKGQDKASERALKIPAIEARLATEERRTLDHEAALNALRSDTARIAEGVAETNGILKVLLKD